MLDLNDHDLLAEFARNKSEEAFATLVSRHVNLVYSAALRFTGNPHHAEEISQAVFVILARKAGSLRRGTTLSGWLYQTARLTAANFIKGETRRQRREQEAYMQSSLNEPEADAWQRIAPLLDDAMGGLGDADRQAVVLRFFENKSAAQVAADLKLTEATAQKRLTRAIGRLRKIFARRGVTLTAAAIAGAVAANSVQAAPSGLTASIAATAGKSATLAASIAVLVKGTLKTMAWAKLKFAAAIGVATVVAGGVAVIAIRAILTDPPANPALARQMLSAIFSHISPPLPTQMRFVAEVERYEKPWTEAQVQAAVQRDEDFDSKRFPQDLSKAPKAVRDQRAREQASLREIRTESTRAYHGGTRTALEREWLAGGLWRLDETETTVFPERIRQMEKPTPPGVEYRTTTIQIGDTNFGKLGSCRIDHGMRWVSFDNSNWSKEAFWQAQTLEPRIAFLLVFAATDFRASAQLLKSKSQSEHDLDSFAGMKLDAGSVEALASGKSLFWRVETGETNSNGRKLAILRLKGRNLSLAHGEEIAFYADADNLTNIYRIEITATPFYKPPYTSIRDDFDSNGFPHLWIVETPNETANPTIRKIVKFKTAELNAQFDKQVEFQPNVPDGYNVTGRQPN